MRFEKYQEEVRRRTKKREGQRRIEKDYEVLKIINTKWEELVVISATQAERVRLEPTAFCCWVLHSNHCATETTKLGMYDRKFRNLNTTPVLSRSCMAFNIWIIAHKIESVVLGKSKKAMS